MLIFAGADEKTFASGRTLFLIASVCLAHIRRLRERVKVAIILNAHDGGGFKPRALKQAQS